MAFFFSWAFGARGSLLGAWSAACWPDGFCAERIFGPCRGVGAFHPSAARGVAGAKYFERGVRFGALAPYISMGAEIAVRLGVVVRFSPQATGCLGSWIDSGGSTFGPCGWLPWQVDSGGSTFRAGGWLSWQMVVAGGAAGSAEKNLGAGCPIPRSHSLPKYESKKCQPPSWRRCGALLGQISAGGLRQIYGAPDETNALGRGFAGAGSRRERSIGFVLWRQRAGRRKVFVLAAFLSACLKDNQRREGGRWIAGK